MGSEMPEIKALIILDTDGSRVACKYCSRPDFPDFGAQTEFERKLYKKVRSGGSKADAEVVLIEGLTCVYKSGTDVNLFVVGSGDENELILVAVLESLAESLSILVRHGLDKRNLFGNLELVLLAMDELVDGGVILELDATAVANRVMLRGAVPESISSYKEMTVGALVEKVRDKAAKQFAK